MGWKDWPSWLKGGVILALIPLIGGIAMLIIHPSSDGDTISYLIYSIYFLIFLGENPFRPLIEFFVFITSYFLIGALIGWLIEKFMR